MSQIIKQMVGTNDGQLNPKVKSKVIVKVELKSKG